MALPVDDPALFAKAFDAAPVSLTITSLVTGKLLHVNETFAQVTGYSRDEAVGRTTVELGLWADNADREAQLALVASRGRIRNVEYRFRARDGRELIGLLSAERLDIRGEPCALTLIEDVTAARRSEAELRLLQQRLFAVTAATSSILASPDPASVTAATIAVARDLFSADAYALWRFEEPAGWRIAESVGISDAFGARIVETNVGRRSRGELDFSEPLLVEDVAETRILGDLRDAYGAEGIASMVIFPMAIRGRRTGTIVFYFRQRRRFSEADLKVGVALANIAAAALAAAELYAAAAEANRLKDEFLATLSHELRTPLNAVLGYARMLSAGIVSGARARPALETLERNATLLTRLIEDVLDVSRIVAGRLQLELQPVDLARVVEDAVATVQPAADAKGVRLERAIELTGAAIEGDPGRLQQMIWNLLANAIKFTQAGGRVRVTASCVGGRVDIVVSDTGSGIAPEFLPYVFDRFRQGEAGFAREHGGLGLGLAIARHVAELHGGTIRAESDGPNQGARFTVSLPLRAVEGVS